MKSTYTILLLLCSFSLLAQKKKIKGIVYTSTSDRYFSSKTTDSIYHDAAKRVFIDNKLSSDVFENTYNSFKLDLKEACRKTINGRFEILLSGYGTSEIERNELLQPFRQIVLDEVQKAIYNNKELNTYLGFRTSDRITHFDSHVKVHTDASLEVTETITVYNGNGTNYAPELAGGSNNEIKRGIVRTFPTIYMDEHKLNRNTTFDLVSVKMDGEKIAYKLSNQNNGKALQIGDGSTLEPGIYTYTIVYKTSNQLKLLPDMDELAWNVTGNGWNFRIDSATCTLELPAGASVRSNACYTGAQDSKARDCKVFYDKSENSESIFFETSKPLLPKQGFSIGTSWNKGIITKKDGAFAGIKKLISENQAVFFMPMLAILIFIYNFLMWAKVGRDPNRGNVIPEFYPPTGLGPAAMGYIYRQGFDNKLIAATITDLAARNIIRIDVQKEGFIFKHAAYHILKPTASKKNAPYKDFQDKGSNLIGTVISKGKYNSNLGSLKTTMESELAADYKASSLSGKGFFALNNQYMAPGNLTTILLFFYLLFAFIPRVVQQNPWQLAYLGGGLILCIVVQRIFYPLMKAYKPEGRAVMDKIEGFRMYMKAADEQRINTMNPPNKTPGLYEAYMPFAIALDCEIQWADQFKDILDKADMTGPSAASGMYNSSNFSHHDFSSSFVSGLSGSISSASSPPSSSSGGGSFSSGGGSSGGGGGGGGGGGW